MIGCNISTVICFMTPYQMKITLPMMCDSILYIELIIGLFTKKYVCTL